MDVLISLIEVFISQCIHIPKHHLKYIQFLSVYYSSKHLEYNLKKKLKTFVQKNWVFPAHWSPCKVPRTPQGCASLLASWGDISQEAASKSK